MTVKVAKAAAIETGLPPNVANVMPGYLSATSGVAMVTATGAPLPMPLALTSRSGSTFQCSMPNQRSPVRPQAVCTSSAMNSPPYLRAIADGAFEISRRRNDEPAGADDRLGHEGGDLAGGAGANQLLDIVGAGQPALRILELERAAIAVRRVGMNEPGHLRGQSLPGGLARGGQRLRGAARVAVPQRDDFESPGGVPGRVQAPFRWLRCRCW